jgi:hypothetical protein
MPEVCYFTSFNERIDFMQPQEPNLMTWSQENKAPQNPSELYEAVLIARIKLPETVYGHCFGVMLADKANEGGNVLTCAQYFPEGEVHQLAYIRLWEPIPQAGLVVRPIVKVMPGLQSDFKMTDNRMRSRAFFDRPIEEMDLALLVSEQVGDLVPTTGFSRIAGTQEQGRVNIFSDLITNPQKALNLITGERVLYVGQSDPEHGVTLRVLVTPFDRVNYGVPYLFDDGVIGITKASGTLDVPAAGEQPAQQVEVTFVIAFQPYIK